MRDWRLITLPRPARHHDLIWYAIEILGYEKPVGRDDIQGFEVKMPNSRYKQFCYREPAKKIAEQNNQLLARSGDTPELFSEDVWEGRFDRDAWLENNSWNLTEDKVPEVGMPVWFFYEHVGVFRGKYQGLDETGDHVFNGIEATHWMPIQKVKPDLPWVCVYEESSIIDELKA